ncbi:hypothetical protein PHEL85_0656 [Polaribacter sp. Hel1_85]|nr:hypothetical protein PHEL85_0656 [Polaribacter sp. Hel1_85]
MLLSKITCACFVKEITIKKPHHINDEAMKNNIPPNITSLFLMF